MTQETGLQFEEQEARSMTIADVLRDRHGLSVRLLNILHIETYEIKDDTPGYHGYGGGFDAGITRDTGIEKLALIPDRTFLRIPKMGRKTLKELRDFLDGKLKDKTDTNDQIDMSHAAIVRRARDEALEEAARICEELTNQQARILNTDGATGAWLCVERIRSRIGRPK